MAESFWLAISLPVAAGVLLSFGLESLLQPRPAPCWTRPPATLGVHVAVWLLLFALELAVFRRPWFAAANALVVMLVIALVSNAKSQALREPFVFQDFEYFTDALKHPRLYIPFLGLWRGIAAIVGVVSALFAGLAFETPLTASLSASSFVAGLAVLAGLAGCLLWPAARRLPVMSHDASADLVHFGLIACLWRYAADERQIPEHIKAQTPFAAVDARPSGELPDLVVVQSESFFDARRLFGGIRTDVLAEFDALKAVSAAHGPLSVAAWGANTVRTEFAFLSGIDPARLGVHRFNPYRHLARQGIPTLVSHLKALGYRTVCIHPYPASFYGRDQVFPGLGFDAFIDVGDFADAQKFGPYIGDLAVAGKISDLLDGENRQPLFIFAITMENHGPLHLERVEPGDAMRLYSAPPPPGCADLTIYLRHLNNADRMVGTLHRRLATSPRAAGLCFFGDHVPIMPGVYSAIGSPDGTTDYLVWKKDGSSAACPTALKVENLGSLLLDTMGLSAAAPDQAS